MAEVHAATNEDRQPAPGQRFETACRVCPGRTLEYLPFRYLHEGRPLYGVRCVSCGTAFLHPMLSDSDIARLYDEEYFTECSDTCGAHGPRAYIELVEETQPDRERGARRLDDALASRLGRRGRFVEIGCGLGHFLDEMRRLGWEVTGLEISEYAANHAREVLGLDVRTGAIAPGVLPRATFDGGFMGDVLEHLPRPLESLSAVRDSLAPGGILAVAVPSTLNLLSGRLGMGLYRARGKFKTLRIPPYHLFEYTPSSLRHTLAAAGFDVISIRQSTVPLRRMGLRGSPVENAGKASFQVIAAATSKVCNCGGDRLLALARRPT